MRKVVFTSANHRYHPNFICLAESVRKYWPDWEIHLFLCDQIGEEIDYLQWFDKVSTVEDLRLSEFGITNQRAWMFQYSVVEFCTAVKGRYAQVLLEQGVDLVTYLDPDICVFRDSSPLEELHQTYDVVLTPHICAPSANENAQSINEHEIATLKHGTFNLGFFSFRNSNNSRSIANWFAHRLLHYSFIDFERGLFTDQKWANLLPVVFDGIHVERSRAWNVATWNMLDRPIEVVGRNVDDALIRGESLFFYHFSGFGNGMAWASHQLESFGAAARGHSQLWDWYAKKLDQELLPIDMRWHYGSYETGRGIPDAVRRFYAGNEQTRKRFPNPYSYEMELATQMGGLGELGDLSVPPEVSSQAGAAFKKYGYREAHPRIVRAIARQLIKYPSVHTHARQVYRWFKGL